MANDSRLRNLNHKLMMENSENVSSLSYFTGDSSVERRFKCLAYAIVVLFSVIGNSLVITTFKLNANGKLRTVNNMFIVSMAAGDLLLTLGSTPERITRIVVSDQWIVEGNLGIFLCKSVNYLEKLCMNVSILHLSMIAIDRFLVVFYPRRKIITKKRALRIIIIAWLASAGYCVPLFYYANLLEKNGQVFCKTRHFFDGWRVWYLVFLSLLVITLLLVVVLYAAIAVRFSRNKTPGVRISFRSRIDARINSRVLKMVAMIVFAFYCCFLPYWIGWVFCSYYVNAAICSDTFVFVSILLLYANCAINPLIYSCFNVNFRVGFRLLFIKLFKRCSTAKRLHHRREKQESYTIAKGLHQMEETDGKFRCKAIKNVGSGVYKR